MANLPNNVSAEAEIRSLIDKSLQGIQALDLDKAIRYFADDVIAYDVIGPLRFVGAAQVRKRLEQWFSSFKSAPIGYELHDLEVVADYNVAFASSLNQVHATLKNGSELQMWWRATLCFQKIDGTWKIRHAHSSIPFNVETGKASTDLKP
jgi:uncharacterized protein (TIGR02246 family)